MHVLVYYVVRFIYVTLGLGSGVRGPGSSDDIHLDPISHPNTRDLTGGKSIKQSLGTSVPAAVRKLVDVFPFPNSRRKVCEDKEINAVQEFRGTAKNFSSNSLSLWLGVVGLMAHLWG